MLGTYITFPELFILIPLLGALLCFGFKSPNGSKNIALATSLITLVAAFAGLFFTDEKYFTYNNVSYIWLKDLGTTYYVGLDGTGRLLTLLTAFAFPIIFGATYNNEYKKPSSFYGLMLLSQVGLMGVFCAMDALVFYFYWELALIPVYFLCSQWGGEKSIQATFKFFIYTFAGSLLMLVGIIYVYLHTPGRTFEDGTTALHSFSLAAFENAAISGAEQGWLFWLFFVAFAIKMPIFPFHTWQPDTYDQSPTAVTMVLSGVMVKMGLLGVLRWLIPIFPEATLQYTNIVMVLCLIGIIYASCLAIVEDNLKKLVAYSSIAHIGLMCAAIFAMNTLSVQGVLVQMFNHGINIIGLWIVVYFIERKTGIKTISALGGIAQKAPALTILLVIVALANIALPLTNAFIGEFMMFAGIWQFNSWYAVIAGVSIILAAVYTLNMIQKIFYGDTNPNTASIQDINFHQKLVLSVIVVAIFLAGIYPQPLINLTKDAVNGLLAAMQ